mmetsp:Transcript_103118/g.315470  ORF Transcript_103118/g.315470 Transcript_103118/m.315470 type:complete len:245 (+) Transcript_103118:159-893(+)
MRLPAVQTGVADHLLYNILLAREPSSPPPSDGSRKSGVIRVAGKRRCADPSAGCAQAVPLDPSGRLNRRVAESPKPHGRNGPPRPELRLHARRGLGDGLRPRRDGPSRRRWRSGFCRRCPGAGPRQAGSATVAPPGGRKRAALQRPQRPLAIAVLAPMHSALEVGWPQSRRPAAAPRREAALLTCRGNLEVLPCLPPRRGTLLFFGDGGAAAPSVQLQREVRDMVERGNTEGQPHSIQGVSQAV